MHNSGCSKDVPQEVQRNLGVVQLFQFGDVRRKAVGRRHEVVADEIGRSQMGSQKHRGWAVSVVVQLQVLQVMMAKNIRGEQGSRKSAFRPI